MVAGIWDVGQTADHGKSTQLPPVERQRRSSWSVCALHHFVSQKHDAFRRRLSRERPVLLAADDFGAVLPVPDRGEAELLADQTESGIVDSRPGDESACHRLCHPVVDEEPGGHLEVEAGVDSLDAVTDAEDPVADDESLESPAFLEDRSEQPAVLPAPFSIERVVGRHDAGHALIDHSLEVGQVDAIEHLGAHPHVHLEPRVLDAVAGEMLGAAHDVSLQTADEGRAHLADMLGVLAVGLLRASPARVA